MAHTHFDETNRFFVDTHFLNDRQLHGLALEHAGFGFFYAETPEGRVNFDRKDGEGLSWEGISGRPHLVRGPGEHWLRNKLQKEVSCGEE